MFKKDLKNQFKEEIRFVFRLSWLNFVKFCLTLIKFPETVEGPTNYEVKFASKTHIEEYSKNKIGQNVH